MARSSNAVRTKQNLRRRRRRAEERDLALIEKATQLLIDRGDAIFASLVMARMTDLEANSAQENRSRAKQS